MIGQRWIAFQGQNRIKQHRYQMDRTTSDPDPASNLRFEHDSDITCSNIFYVDRKDRPKPGVDCDRGIITWGDHDFNAE